MKEEKHNPYKSKLPDDAKKIKQIGAYEIYLSNSQHSIYFVTADYHAGALKVSKEDLLELLKTLESSGKGSFLRLFRK